MKKTTLLATSTALFFAVTASAQSERISQMMTSTNLNRFTLSYRMGLNLNLSFRGVGAFAGPNAGPATGSAVNRFYDDGYNGIDSTGNGERSLDYHVTWNWGVSDVNSQVLPSPNNPQSVVMHSDSSLGATTSGHSEDPQPGFEINYNRELFRKEHWSAGLEAAFGYTSLDMSDNSPVQFDVNRVTDTYAVPPGTGSGQGFPTTGSYSHGPVFLNGAANPVIGSTPSRVPSVLSGSVTGQRHFDADIYGFRFGPYFEFPLSQRVAFNLSAGFALVYLDSEFSSNETITIPGIGSGSTAGSGSHSGWLPGGYVAANISVALSEKWALVAGAQFEDVGQYTQDLNGKQATLDLRNSIFVTVGLSYSF